VLSNAPIVWFARSNAHGPELYTSCALLSSSRGADVDCILQVTEEISVSAFHRAVV
jgi:hypothetical protein